jgi:predicted transposase YdaD
MDRGHDEKNLPPLELEVKVININQGRSPEIVEKSKTLYGYSIFIAKIREYEKETGNREGAMKEAIKYCLAHGILEDFLKQHATEVMSMLLTEWDWNDAKEVWTEEAWEGGREEGLEEGLEKGREEEREEIARNALAKGASIEFVQEITGLGMEALKNLQTRL